MASWGVSSCRFEASRAGAAEPEGAGGLEGQLAWEAEEVRKVMSDCAMLAAIAGKAHRLGWVSGDERRTMMEVMLGLGGERGREASAEVLAPAGVARADVDRAMRAKWLHRLSCAKVRARHEGLASEVGCACTFARLMGGAYPTPALHAVRVHQVKAFRAARDEARERVKGRRQGAMSPSEAPAAKATSARAASRDERSGVAAPFDDDTVAGLVHALGGVHSAEATMTDRENGMNDRTTGSATGLDDRVRPLLEKVRRQREQIENATMGLRKVEAELSQIFEEVGENRIRVAGGWLVRVPGNPPRYFLEL